MICIKMKRMVDTYYNGSTSTDWGNWYHWEIGNSQALAATLMIVQDSLTKEQMVPLSSIIRWHILPDMGKNCMEESECSSICWMEHHGQSSMKTAVNR